MGADAVAFIATTTVDIYGPEVDIAGNSPTNAYGDKIYGDSILRFEGVEAAVGQESKTVWNPADQRYGTVRRYTVLLPPTVRPQKGWKIVDRESTLTYIVEDVYKPRNFVWDTDIRAYCNSVE